MSDLDDLLELAEQSPEDVTPEQWAYLRTLGVSSAPTLEAKGWKVWYAEIFGQSFVDALDSAETDDKHHSEAIEWHWESRRALLQGKRPPNDWFAYFPTWSRGHLKSTIAEAMVVTDAGLSYLYKQPGFCLYLRREKDKLQESISNIESLLSSDAVRNLFPLLSQVARNEETNQKRQWTASFLHTKAGYVIRGGTIMSAQAGSRIGKTRPTFIVPDDIEGRDDSPVIAESILKALTTEIIPMRQANTITFWAQNLISRYTVRYKIEHGQAIVLANRKPTVPVPAVRELETELQTINGQPMDVYLSGRSTWRGWDKQRIQDEINSMGLPAFLRECQHEVDQDRQGRVIPEYEDYPDRRTHVISWSQFAAKFGQPRIPAIWQCECGLDIGYTAEHLTAWSFIATSAENSPLPNKKFRYRGLTYEAPLLDDMAEDVKRRLWMDEKIIRWRISHEKKGERMTLNQKHGFHFSACKSAKMSGIPQWRHYLRVDHKRPHPFHADTLLPNGTYLLGEPSWFDVVADSQLDSPINDAGLKLHREQTLNWLYAPTPLTDTGMREAVPLKASEDTNDSTRMVTAEWGPGMTYKTVQEKREEKMKPGVRLVDIPQIPDTVERDRAVQSHKLWEAHFKAQENLEKSKTIKVVFKR